MRTATTPTAMNPTGMNRRARLMITRTDIRTVMRAVMRTVMDMLTPFRPTE